MIDDFQRGPRKKRDLQPPGDPLWDDLNRFQKQSHPIGSDPFPMSLMIPEGQEAMIMINGQGFRLRNENGQIFLLGGLSGKPKPSAFPDGFL